MLAEEEAKRKAIEEKKKLAEVKKRSTQRLPKRRRKQLLNMVRISIAIARKHLFSFIVWLKVSESEEEPVERRLLPGELSSQ